MPQDPLNELIDDLEKLLPPVRSGRWPNLDRFTELIRQGDSYGYRAGHQDADSSRPSRPPLTVEPRTDKR
jgi:hypothetical protein